MSAKKRYDVDFKKEIALSEWAANAEELGLHVNTIYKWLDFTI